MPAQTYATDIYLTCPCTECKDREVRITLRKFRNISRLPSPACEQVVHQLVSGAITQDQVARPGARHRPGLRSH